jgi:hypothetical protein
MICTGIFSLTECFVLKYSCGLNIRYDGAEFTVEDADLPEVSLSTYVKPTRHAHALPTSPFMGNFVPWLCDPITISFATVT